MRAPVTHDVLLEKESRASVGAMSHHHVATLLLAWAKDPQEQDELSVAELLVNAGEQFALANEHVHALRAYRRASQCEAPTSPDARGFMIGALLHLGHTQEAEELSAQLRRARPGTAVTYHLVGEAWEAAGDLNRANHWLTRGVILAEQQGARGQWAMLLLARWRVRDALGLPADDYDEAALHILQENNADHLRQDQGADPARP